MIRGVGCLGTLLIPERCLMDYVEWCDYLANELADYAEANDRWVHLQVFARHLIEKHQWNPGNALETAIVLDSAEVMRVCGIDVGGPQIHLKFAHLTGLRDHNSRWLSAQQLEASLPVLLL